MKRKLSTSLLIAALVVVLLAGAAYALSQSSILNELFVGVTPPPQAEQLLVQSEMDAGSSFVVANDTLSVQLDEYLYDGNELKLYWTVTSLADEPIIFAGSSLTINGYTPDARVVTAVSSDRFDFMQMLGGTVDGKEIPKSFSFMDVYGSDLFLPDANASTQNPNKKIATQRDDAWLHIAELDQVVLEWDVVVWKPAHEGNIPTIYETTAEYIAAAREKKLPVWKDGSIDMSGFVDNDFAAQVPTREAWRRYYVDQGYVLPVSDLNVSISIDMPALSLQRHTEPRESEYETKDYLYQMEKADFAAATTEISFKIYRLPLGSTTSYGENYGFLQFEVCDTEGKAYDGFGIVSNFQTDEQGFQYQYTYIHSQLSEGIFPTPPERFVLVPFDSHARARDLENAITVDLLDNSD